MGVGGKKRKAGVLKKKKFFLKKNKQREDKKACIPKFPQCLACCPQMGPDRENQIMAT